MAYVLTCGNHQSTREGAETKHLQPAIAGSNGLLAALMASQKVDAVAQPFLGEDGLNRVYLHERLDLQRCLRDEGIELPAVHTIEVLDAAINGTPLPLS